MSMQKISFQKVRSSLQCRLILASDRAYFDQASAIKLGRGLGKDERVS